MYRCCFLFFLMILFPEYGYGQDTLLVKIQPVSTLEIHGKTNINSFTCSQTHRLPQGLKEISLYQDGNVVAFDNAQLNIPVNDFDCGHKIMTKDFQEILESDKNPYLLIHLHTVHKTSAGLIADVSIRIAGVTRRYRIPINVTDSNQALTGKGERQVKFSEFNLDPPVKFMGMVKVKEELNISFNISIAQLK